MNEINELIHSFFQYPKLLVFSKVISQLHNSEFLLIKGFH